VHVTAQPQVAPITISGTVQVDEDRATEPVSGATVQPVGFDNSATHEVTTDPQGHLAHV
jgi:hypothetical protein